VDDVELVLYESDDLSNLPTPADVAEMARLARESGLTYTVHFPLDTQLGSRDEAERTVSVGRCRRVVELMSAAAPFAWVLHLHGDHRGDPPSHAPAQWRDQNRRSLEELLETPLVSRRVCVETLDYGFEHIADLIEEYDLSVCADLGHLLVNGQSVDDFLDRWFERCLVFHVHGLRPDGTDHADLGGLPAGVLEDLATRLAQLPHDDQRVVTMEVFGEEDFNRSLEVARERLAPWLK
jgi:sugar phosphate isomerase/epimerase